MAFFSARALRALCFLGPATLALYAPAACSSDDTEEGEDQPNPELADVIYAGGTSDEALEQLLGATPISVAGKGATFDTPADASEVPAGSPAVFTWHTGGTASLPQGHAPRATRGSRWAAPLVELVGPERAAHAHGAPLNGTAYFLVLSTAGNDKLVRVFTTAATYTPDAAAWDKIKAAGGAVTAKVTTAVFDNNALAADGGPFEGKPITFTVTP